MARIRDVWAPNLDSEMRAIRNALDTYAYVALDLELPGDVARPIGTWSSASDFHYQTMRCNAELLKVIQVGITLTDEEGNFPEEASTWQFNLKWNISEEMYYPEHRHEEFGIHPNDFAEFMITSGLVLSKDVKYISYHSGYDFGFFLSILSGTGLPVSDAEYYDLLSIWFPTIYDLKVILRAGRHVRSATLQGTADDLGIQRIGPANQAGSDSLLAALLFWKVHELWFTSINDEHNHKFFGLNFILPAQNEADRSYSTAAEREDRTIPRDIQNGLAAATVAAQNNGVTMTMPPMQGLQNPLSANPYALGPPQYMRSSLVGGR
ncbi:ribonuclease H-like domain-containing protein [Flagelloscypha sp. PMI_526]|nr:ribonuclease H-like domain-containing protein [Flagelloscypha sp. PMI_526]